MKIPKTFNKMSVSDQENWLVKKLMELQQEENKLRRLLATVRGGNKLVITAEERPDEILLKETA